MSSFKGTIFLTIGSVIKIVYINPLIAKGKEGFTLGMLKLRNNYETEPA